VWYEYGIHRPANKPGKLFQKWPFWIKITNFHVFSGFQKIPVLKFLRAGARLYTNNVSIDIVLIFLVLRPPVKAEGVHKVPEFQPYSCTNYYAPMRVCGQKSLCGQKWPQYTSNQQKKNRLKSILKDLELLPHKKCDNPIFTDRRSLLIVNNPIKQAWISVRR